MAKAKPLVCRGFIGTERDGYRPLEELSQEELEEWRARVAERVGRALSDYYSVHIDEYQRLGA